MTQIVCSVLLYASKLKLIYRSFKSLKHFELLSDEALLFENTGGVPKHKNQELSCKEYDSILSRLDWDVLVQWSLMGVYHTINHLKIEAVLSAVVPFYYIIKMAFLISTFLWPHTKMPSFILFSLVVPAINEAHLYVNNFIEDDPWKIALFVLDLMWPGTLYPTCKPEDITLVLKHQESCSDESDLNSNATAAIKMKALRWKQLQESSSSLNEVDKMNENKIMTLSSEKTIERDCKRSNTNSECKTVKCLLQFPTFKKSFASFELQNDSSMMDNCSDDDSLSAWQQNMADPSEVDECKSYRNSLDRTYSLDSPVTKRKISDSSMSLKRFSMENKQLLSSPTETSGSKSPSSRYDPKRRNHSRRSRNRRSIGDRLKSLVTGDSHTRLTDYLLDLNLPQNYCIGSNVSKVVLDGQLINDTNENSDIRPNHSSYEDDRGIPSYRRSRRLAARKKID